MKPWVERRDVRVLAEITPEALRVLRELDRAFADMFHIIHIDEPTRADSLKMLLSVVREAEQTRCQFAPNVIPIVTDLCRRFDRNSAMPGAAAEMIRGLASRTTGRKVVGRVDVLDDFRQRSGLNLAFVDQSQRLERDEVIRGPARGHGWAGRGC